ncbi:C2 calcium-dependent domain-containing protein 6-like isoform X1 [Amphibalanus amphitrite]|uniref:C2 calcium-dependent domain-containing protein 6-like isoform X1 n=1 Tax=Amphibalanus amphitrite TaxID=1232801 RepID=UPI001C928EE2|nr:C2 calcium-dependent domain-containing protein 6-like isoform X1 [Amphibalanus amphitrite]
MTLNPQLHVDPTTIRDPSLAPYIAASTVGKVTGSEFDEADEVLSTDTTEALREAAKKRADTYDEEDPQSNKTPVAPVGLLAMHLLNMKSFDQTANDEDLSDPGSRFKILISIGDVYKETGWKRGSHKHSHTREKDKVVNVLTGVAVDEVKHFSLTVPQQLSDPKNVLKLELYRSLAGDGPSVEPRIMGMVEVHLHEIIQAMMVIDVLPLSLNGKHVADLYLEFAFMYGALGFHYSTQLENPGFNPNRDLARTMFPRVALPEDRDGEVLLPVPQHPPAFIPWTCPVTTHWDEAVRRAPEGPEPTTQTGFTERVRSEVRHILDDYVPLRSRADRLAFLRKLVRGAPGPGQSADAVGGGGSGGGGGSSGGGKESAGASPGPSTKHPDRKRPDADQWRTTLSEPEPGPDQRDRGPPAVRSDQTAQLRQSSGSTSTLMPALVSRTAPAPGPGSAGWSSPPSPASSSAGLAQQSQQLQQLQQPVSRPSRPSDTEPAALGPQRSGSSAAKIMAPKQIRRAPLRRPAGDSSSSVVKPEEEDASLSADTAVEIQ